MSSELRIKIKMMSGDIITINEEKENDEGDEGDEGENVEKNIFFVLKNILENDYGIIVDTEQIKLFKVNEEDDYFCLFIENNQIEIIEDISLRVMDCTGRQFERYIIRINNKLTFILYKRQRFEWEVKTKRLFWIDYVDWLIRDKSTRRSNSITYPNTFVTSQIEEKEFTRLKDIFTAFRSGGLVTDMEKYGISKDCVIDSLFNFFGDYVK